jgi:hypothetical protein
MISNPLPNTNANINGPKVLNPKSVSYLIGTVVKRSEDNEKDKAYQVKFNIDGLPEFTEEFPVATPLFDSVREVNVGDKIIVFNLSNSPGMYTFFYFPLRQERFTGLKNYKHLIDITEEGEVKIVFPNYTATFSDSSITIDAKNVTKTMKGNIELTGSLTVKGNIIVQGGDVTADTISLKLHTHQYAPGPGTPTPTGPAQ